MSLGDFLDSLCCQTTRNRSRSRSHSRSSGGHAHGRGRSGRSRRHEDQDSRDRRHHVQPSASRTNNGKRSSNPYSPSKNRSSRSREHSGQRYSHPPPVDRTTLPPRRVRTDPLDTSHRSQGRPSQPGPPRRSTLPTNLQRTDVTAATARLVKPRSGFNTLENRHAYIGLDGLNKTERSRMIDRQYQREPMGRSDNSLGSSRLTGEGPIKRDYQIDVKTDASARPFAKLPVEFWDRQLKEHEKRAAMSTCEADIVEAYDPHLHPYLNGVLKSLTEAKRVELARVKWPDARSFALRIMPSRVKTIDGWKKLFEDMAVGDRETGRWIAANHLSELQLSQAQLACDTAGRPFWEMASIQRKQDSKSELKSALKRRDHDTPSRKNTRVSQLIEGLQDEYKTGLDPADDPAEDS